MKKEDKGWIRKGTRDWVFPHKELTEQIIGAAIAVHKELGPGFIEEIYENAMVIELTRRGHSVQRQIWFQVLYAGEEVGKHRCDLIVDGEVIVELKAGSHKLAVDSAQLLSTLKAAGKVVGLLMYFGMETIKEGLERVINSH